MRLSTSVALALALALVLGCQEPPGLQPSTEITLTPLDTTIAWGSSVQLEATLHYSGGLPIRASKLGWAPLVEFESLDPSVATVSSTGRVQAQGPSGAAVIRATRGQLSTLARVTVLDSMVVARARLSDRSYAAAISIGDVAFVSQSDLSSVVRVDLQSHTFSDTIIVGDTPTEMAFNATGSRLYVTNQYSSTISVIDVSTNTVIDQIPVGNRPFEVIVEPGDSILWTGKIDSLYGIRLSTKEIIARFQIGAVGNGVAIARDTLLYVSTHGTGTIVEINLRTRTLGRTFSVGGVPQKLVVSPNGTELYIANQDGYIQFWDLNSGAQIGSNLALPSAAYGLARRSSNGLLYATSAYFGDGYVYVIDPVTRTLVHSAVFGGSTRHIVFTTDGSAGLVPNEGGWVDFMK